jgi:hypothetical protein
LGVILYLLLVIGIGRHIIGAKGLACGLPLRVWLKAQGTGHKAKTIKENSSSPYALRLTPYAFEECDTLKTHARD